MIKKLLILTQKADKNDPILGFFHKWIELFASHYEKVTVICLGKGEYSFPQNVKVLSLGKEEKVSRLVYLWRFYKYIWTERKNYDAVFVHMNPIYVVLSGFLWRALGKKVFLWYTHRSVDLKLKIAYLFSDRIFTASRQSFNIKSDKVHIMGHGIDFDKLKMAGENKKTEKFNIISVGRITPIKNLDVLIKACAGLLGVLDFELTFVGSPVSDGDREYEKKLKTLIKEKNMENRVIFAGSVPNSKICEYYVASDLSVNLAPTGGVDKAVLESMASGTPAMASNLSFETHFGKYSDRLLFKENDYEDLQKKIDDFAKSSDKKEMAEYLSERVRESSDLKSLVKKISEIISNS